VITPSRSKMSALIVLAMMNATWAGIPGWNHE
jgi:hypothetical protein